MLLRFRMHPVRLKLVDLTCCLLLAWGYLNIILRVWFWFCNTIFKFFFRFLCFPCLGACFFSRVSPILCVLMPLLCFYCLVWCSCLVLVFGAGVSFWAFAVCVFSVCVGCALGRSCVVFCRVLCSVVCCVLSCVVFCRVLCSVALVLCSVALVLCSVALVLCSVALVLCSVVCCVLSCVVFCRSRVVFCRVCYFMLFYVILCYSFNFLYFSSIFPFFFVVRAPLLS